MKYWLPLLLAALFISPALYGRVTAMVDSLGNITFTNTASRTVSKRHHPPAKLPESRFDTMIDRIAEEENIDSKLIKCIIKAESDFVPHAVSEAGAMGLMQLMQATAEIYGVDDPLEPEQNIRAGVKHFKAMMAQFDNSVPLALAAYHAGAGAVRKNMRVPDIRSTKLYVDRVMTLYTGRGPDKNTGKRETKLKQKVDSNGDIIIYSE